MSDDANEKSGSWLQISKTRAGNDLVTSKSLSTCARTDTQVASTCPDSSSARSRRSSPEPCRWECGRVRGLQSILRHAIIIGADANVFYKRAARTSERRTPPTLRTSLIKLYNGSAQRYLTTLN